MLDPPADLPDMATSTGASPVCLKDCLYYEVLRRIGIGVLVFDAERREILFQNRAAQELLDCPQSGGDLAFYESRLEAGLDGLSRAADGIAREVRLGDRFVGYSSYRVHEPYGWVFLRDITERKNVEEKLRETEERFDVIAATAADAILVLDHVGRLTYWNPAASAMFGYTPQEVLGKELHRLLAPSEMRENLGEGLVRFARTGRGPMIGRTVALEAVRRNGRRFPVEASVSAFRHRGQWHAVGFLRDVTERRRVEDELKRSIGLFQTVADLSSDWTYWSGPDRRLLYVAPACEAISGYKPEELASFPELLDQMVHPEDRPAWEAHSVAARAGEESGHVEYRIITKKGDVRWVRHVCRSVHSESGAFMGVRASNTDVTDLKLAEAERTRLVAAVESSADAICVTDCEGVVQYVNPAFEKLSGFSSRDAVGRALVELAGPQADDQGYAAMLAAVGRGDGWSGHVMSRRPDGTVYRVEMSVAPIRSPVGAVEYFVAVGRDVTERDRLESIAAAVNAMDNIGWVFSGIRHELGNPINSIKTTLTVLRSNIDRYEKETVVEYVDRTLKEIGRVEYLLKALKNFNMFESPELAPIDVRPFMGAFRALVEKDLEQRGVAFEVLVQPDVRSALADPRALQQALLNVVGNAADAVAEAAEPRVSLAVFRGASKVHLRVIDNGEGMTERQLKDLFRPFYTTKAKGTGLGLVITRKMLTRMGGEIDVTSERGAGTVVEIRLPESTP